ncbi:Lar family restriction alleviation protein [Salmonella enterica]|nr:Lar family restriction alleviation protein [Salmonella enterica subsp. enterica serovar Java]EHS1339428.1 Lar family restriction alleviation protein [Salmonella enterica subsp. enterica serovar Java]EIX4921036.1 Lar family restriction alleviation protein [Salmonella enterica]ELI4282141.1 Lar family restriction alleviation protein [Salmonella enterica]
MKENQITASMAKDIAFKLGAVLNDEEAEIFANGYNAALLKVNKNASTELPNYANLSTSSQAAPDDSVLLPCPFCGSPAEHYPDGDMEGYIIMCGNKNGDCNLQAFGFTTPQEAEKAWNTRAALLQGGQPVSNHDELQVIGWLRSDYNSDDKRDPNAPLFMLGRNDPSEAWGVKYIPLSGNSPVIPGVYLADINTDHQH